MGEKRVTYTEFLEIVDLVAIQKNGISIRDGSMYFSTPKSYSSVKLGNEISYQENDTVIELRTDLWWITIWRNVEQVHFHIW